jgi:hypothetical protein
VNQDSHGAGEGHLHEGQTVRGTTPSSAFPTRGRQRGGTGTGELAFYRCFAPTPVPLATLVRVAGRRWTIEESFQAGKGRTRLDEHQVRRWTSWHRWTSLAMLAHAFLAITAVIARAETPSPQGLIVLTANGVRHLFTRLIHRPLHTARHTLEWSQRRRRHQAPSPRMPPWPADRSTRMITNYGWSTKLLHHGPELSATGPVHARPLVSVAIVTQLVTRQKRRT